MGFSFATKFHFPLARWVIRQCRSAPLMLSSRSPQAATFCLVPPGLEIRRFWLSEATKYCAGQPHIVSSVDNQTTFFFFSSFFCVPILN